MKLSNKLDSGLPIVPVDRWPGLQGDEDTVRQWILFASHPLTLRVVWIVRLGLIETDARAEGIEEGELTPEIREEFLSRSQGLNNRLTDSTRGMLHGKTFLICRMKSD